MLELFLAWNIIMIFHWPQHSHEGAVPFVDSRVWNTCTLCYFENPQISLLS